MGVWQPVVASVICLVVAAAAATLQRAFRISRRAGLARLADRLPLWGGAAASWEQRWPRLCAALLLVHSAALAGAFAAAALALARSPRSPAAIVGFAAIVLASGLAFDIAPRALSEGFADRLSLAFLLPATALSILLYPLAAPIAIADEWISRRLRARSSERDRPTAEDAIMSLVERAPRADLGEDERRLIRRVFELGETVVREIMTPRVDIVAVSESETACDCLRRVADHKYSRYPATRGTLDTIVGIAHIKDLALAVAQGRADTPVAELIKEALFVPETMRLDDLLDLMRERREHLAIVVDEFGGTAGLVTMEDALEELVGEIRDEFDEDEHDATVPEGDIAIVDARLPISELNARMNAGLPENAGYDTVGGYIAGSLGRIPRKGDVVMASGVRLIVESATPRRALRVRVERLTP